MSAPQSAYSANTFELHNVGVVKYDNLIALKLSEYGSDIKELFYLDLLFIVQNGNNQDFIGAVRSFGDNFDRHATARLGKGRLKRDTDGNIYILLNDAGLNTKGVTTATIQGINSDGNLVVNLVVKSAYYVDTDNYGLVGNLVNETVPRNTTVAKTIEFGGMSTGDILNYQAVCINAEGSYITNVPSYTVPRAEFIVSYGADFPSVAYEQWLDNYRHIYYRNIGPNSDGKVFTEPTGNTKPAASYYADANKWYQINNDGVIVLVGDIGDWPTDDPAYIPVYNAFSFLEYAASTYGPTCTFITRPDYVPEIKYTLYYAETVDKWYQMGEGTPIGENQFVADGYYFSSSGSPIDSKFIHIQNGIKIADGDCQNGEQID